MIRDGKIREGTCISMGNLETVSARAASNMSNGTPAKRLFNLASHRSKAVGVMCDELGPSTSSSVLLHQTKIMHVYVILSLKCRHCAYAIKNSHEEQSSLESRSLNGGKKTVHLTKLWEVF